MDDDSVQPPMMPQDVFVQVLQLLINADAVARQKGYRYGLCDGIDDAGTPYRSTRMALWLDIARTNYGVTPAEPTMPPGMEI